jgi:hypothetical protein
MVRRKSQQGAIESTERSRCEQGPAAPKSRMTMALWEPEARKSQSPSVDGQLSWSKTWRGLLARDGNPYYFPAIPAHGQHAIHGADNRGCCMRYPVLMMRVREAQAASQTEQGQAEWLERVASRVRVAQVPADAIFVRIFC